MERLIYFFQFLDEADRDCETSLRTASTSVSYFWQILEDLHRTRGYLNFVIMVSHDPFMYLYI